MITFLGPLSGDPFYLREYPEQAAAFAARMPAGALAVLQVIKQRSDSLKTLLSPFLASCFSAGPDATIADILNSIDHADTVLRPKLAESDLAFLTATDQSWGELIAALMALRGVFVAMRDAGFAEFRAAAFEAKTATRFSQLTEKLTQLDLIGEIERMTGVRRDPAAEVILLEYCRPHGIRVIGQRFLTAIDWGDDITIRNAVHELLHRPIDMEGEAVRAALAVLAEDELVTRIVAEHNPSFGYNSLDSLFDEDLTSALDQIINERIGMARDPAVRWNGVDDGMHVLSAGLYGLMRESGYAATGGDLAAWLADLVAAGGLAPLSLHSAAARVLGRPPGQLWPVLA